MPTRHSVYGGSNAPMWLACAGGVTLRAITPPRPVGRAAEEGTAQHEIMDMLLNDPELKPEKFLGSTILGIEITKAHINNINIALDAYLQIEDSFPNATYLKSEQEVMLTDDAFGTFDAGMVQGKRGAIIDFKFGQIEVGAEAEQLKVYAVYAMKSEPAFANVQEFELYVIQPAMDPAIDKIVMPRQALETFESTIYAAIKVSKSPNPPFVEGEHCEWCHAKLVCPSKLQRLPTLTQPNHIMDLQDLGAQVLKFEEWKKWITEAKERLQHEIEHGHKNEHWLLTPKRATRKWKNEAETIKTFEEHHVSALDYMVTELISPAQAEEQGLLKKPIVKTLAHPVSSGNTIAPRSSGKKEVISAVGLGEILKKLT